MLYLCKLLQTAKISTMPKVKTNSSAKKRFKLTGSGKIKRKKAFRSHILTKKSRKTKRNLGQTSLINKADEPRVLRQLNV
jgi:large subunit ribosomal protein L35